MPRTDVTALTPRISVVVPTCARPERAATLLARLDEQTLDPADFEVVLVDDGSPVPLQVDAARHRFPVRVVRQAKAGPAAARNAGVAQARAPLILFLNDDAEPQRDLLTLHLQAQAAAAGPVAVLGAFPFTERSLREPFTRLLARSSLLFDFERLRDGELHGWTFFWTCNLSIGRAALEAAGGFDPAFPEAIVEDVELGYRLERLGVRVLYRADAVCLHEHALTADAYFRRAVLLGVNLARMWRKHRDPRLLYQAPGTEIGPAFLRAVQLRCEANQPRLDAFLTTLRQWEAASRDRTLNAAEVLELQRLVRDFAAVPFLRGVLLELAGTDPGPVVTAGPARGRLTSIVICSHDALDKTRRCLDSLRRTADPDHPTELLVVDNGSADGSAEWLAAQPDLHLVRNAGNDGAPRARNQALALARGEHVVFMDNDIVVTPGWLGRLLHHAEVDGRAACVGACADRASHGQVVAYEGPTDFDSLARFAGQVAGARHRQARLVATLASFCMLVKRAVVERFGGFDERFSPWGFEDDDYTFRPYLAGYHSRIALDVFVHHDTYAGPRLERHQRLLQRNWGLFTQKWGLGDVPYGDFSGLAAAVTRPWPPEQLFVEYQDPAPDVARLAASVRRVGAAS